MILRRFDKDQDGYIRKDEFLSEVVFIDNASVDNNFDQPE
jgi:Ca2+-binding EF-hand superfamily protein